VAEREKKDLKTSRKQTASWYKAHFPTIGETDDFDEAAATLAHNYFRGPIGKIEDARALGDTAQMLDLRQRTLKKAAAEQSIRTATQWVQVDGQLPQRIIPRTCGHGGDASAPCNGIEYHRKGNRLVPVKVDCRGNGGMAVIRRVGET